MTTAVDAIHEGGVFKPESPVDLEDKTKVHLLIQQTTSTRAEGDPTGWKTADELIGFIKGGPKGPIGREHDEQIYGK